MPKQANGKPLGAIDERFRGMNAKQVFDILKEEEEEDGGGGGGFDEHDWEGAKALGEQAKKELERDIDSAIRQGLIAEQKVVGKGGGGMGRDLSELLEPKVDWRDVLREFVKTTCNAKDTSSWRRVNRRYLSSDIYMPSLIGERVGHLVIGIDTSGSVGAKELNEFLSEVQAIAKDVHPDRVDLIYWDGEVAGHEEYSSSQVDSIIDSTKPAGGGGTDPTCVMEYMEEKAIKPEAIIMLTDGYIGNWGDKWNAPILWTIVGNNKEYAPVGKTIHVKD
jgi:predicted metal-dependent peptidase